MTVSPQKKVKLYSGKFEFSTKLKIFISRICYGYLDPEDAEIPTNSLTLKIVSTPLSLFICILGLLLRGLYSRLQLQVLVMQFLLLLPLLHQLLFGTFTHLFPLGVLGGDPLIIPFQIKRSVAEHILRSHLQLL